MRPYQMLFLQFLPESPDPLGAREQRLSLQWDAANVMLAPGGPGSTVLEDTEVHRLLAVWRSGTSHGGEVTAALPVVWRTGGFMDGIISAWHRVLGIGATMDVPTGRDSYPQGQSIVYLADPAGRVLVDRGGAFGWGDLSVTHKWPVGRRTPRAGLAARLGVKLPTGNPGMLLGSGGVDIGAMLDTRYAVGRDTTVYAGLGGALLGRAASVPNRKPALAQVLFAVEYRANNHDSYLWQIEGSGAAVRTGNAFADRAAVTASFAYRRVLDRHRVLTVGFSENGDYQNYAVPVLGGIGPDFTTTIGLEWRH
jgi:hypothetical protein